MLSTSKTDKQKDKEGQSQHSRSSKPLHNKRFYLDLKSHVATNNLEQKLKSLGASVEWFLVKEVNYVVTDRPNWTPGSGGSVSSNTPKCGILTPLGGLCSNESPATLDSPGDVPRGGARRSKTRAEAMLERARLQPQQFTVDPLENATRWSIPIWPLDKVLKWLDKIREKYLKPSSSSSGTVLKNPYIKLENINSAKHRPLYKEFSVWPNINFDFEAGGCPFSPPKESKKKSKPKPEKECKDAEKRTQPTKATVETPRMTRKSRGPVQRGHETPVALHNSGYCEVCQQTYVDQKKHIVSDRHVQFVRNNSNFVSLDHLIHKGPNMEAFLKLNGVNEISDCESELSGNSRRSLRSVVKLHSLTLDTTTPQKTCTNGLPANQISSGGNRTPEEENKMLLQQKESLEVQCNGIWSHSYDTRHGGMKSPISGNIARRVQWEIQLGGGRPQRMRRASASYCTPSLQQQLSPTGSDSGHHLRSRGQIWLPSNLLGTTAEDEAFPSRTRLADPQPARTSRDIPVTRCETEVKPPPCRNQTIRRKRLSVEEKLIEDNRAYYKIELKNSKLRSSGYYPSQRDLEPPVKQEVKEEKVKVECNGDQGHKVEEPVPTKFHRVRRSELTLLSDEAESFMFGEPTRKESSTESSEEEEENSKSKINRNSRKENSNEESNVKKPSDHKKGGGNVVKVKVEGEDGIQCSVLQCDESSVGSIDTCSLASSCDTNTVVQKKRKRRTHAEAFIHDNLDYYKFEIPGSRLRFQGSILPPTLTAPENKSPGRITNNSENKLPGRTTNNSENKLPGRTTNNSENKSPGRTTNNSENKSPGRTTNNSENKLSGRTNNSENKLPGRTTNNSENKLSGRTTNNSENKLSGRTTNNSENKLSGRTTNNSENKLPGRTTNNSENKSPGRTTNNSENKLPGKTTNNSENKSPGRTTNNSENKLPGRTTNNSKGSKATCNGAHSKVVTCSNEASNEKEKIVQTHEESKDKTDRETESKSGKKPEKDDDKKKEEKDESNFQESMENDLSPTMEKLHFSFEVIPQSEPWYQTYTRQDEGEEFYAYAHMSDACYWKPFLLPYEMPMPEVSSGTGSTVGPGPSGFVKKRRNRFAHLLDKKPRKSPRCHASTLAILSSLMHHRRRKEPDKSKEENSKSETSVGNSTEDESVSRDVPANTDPGTSSETSQASEPEVAPPVVPNSDFKSESDRDLHEIARNIDKMFGVGSDVEDVSGSENDVSGDDVKQETAVPQKPVEHKVRKPGKKGKKGSGAKKKKVEVEPDKKQEVLEIDPAVIEELSMEPPPIVAVDHTELRCRGGPKMDVVTLIDEFSTCRCMEVTTIIEKETIHGLYPSLLLGEASCNSSECGASSTCETVNMSDGPEGRVFHIRGRRRKRKKNLTGWPAEKQRGKKKQLNKVNRIDENVPTNKCGNIVAKSVSEKIDKKDSEGTGMENDRVEENKKEVESEQSVVNNEKHAPALSRTESVDSSEYQPCVRVTKMPDLSSSSYYVAGISNNRRLRSSSLSSSPPRHSVPLPRKYPSLSADGLKRRASPRKCASLQWNAWSARRQR